MSRMIPMLGLLAVTNANASTVAVYYDYGTSYAATAATNLGHSAMAYYNDGPGFAAAAASANMLIVESGNWYPGIDVENAVGAAISSGKPVIVFHWSWGQDPAYGMYLGVSAIDYYVPESHNYYAGASANFFSGFSGGLIATPDMIFGVNGSYLTLTGGGWYAGQAAGGRTIAVTNNDRAIANGWLTWDYASQDSDGDGKLDMLEVVEAEIDYLFNGGGPTITLGGSCPSAVTVSASGFTPNGNVAIVRSNGTGSFAIPSGSCAGTMLGLSASGIGVVTTIHASAAGTITYAGSVSSGICSKYIQFVDMATCSPSNVDTF